MTETVTITEVVADHGTIVEFRTDDGRTVGVDHRPAQGLVDLLADGPVEAEVEFWQIRGVA